MYDLCIGNRFICILNIGYNEKNPEIVSISAKTDGYKDLNDLESKSTIIITGIKKDEEKPIIGKSPNGVPELCYVTSNSK